MIEVLSTGGLSTVQDAGRRGYRRFGVGVSGPLDALAASVGNAMLGNDPGCAFIEIVLFPFRVRFTADTCIAVTGADVRGTLDGVATWPWWCMPVRAGQVLSLAPPASGGVGYLCVAGGIDVPVVLGSRSTDLKAAFGGFQGRPLRRGDLVGWQAPAAEVRASRSTRGFGVQALRVPGGDHREGSEGEGAAATEVRVLPAAEWPGFTDEAVEAFLAHRWKISPNSNRQGVRLEGPALAMRGKPELLSHGIVPGVVQVPPSGLPIVMQCDAQTAGGYPKIATVIAADLWRVAQTPAGGHLRFRTVTLQAAQDADAAQRDYLARVRRAARLGP